MNPLGLHAMVVTTGGDATAVAEAAGFAAATGYDLLEFPILDPSTLDVAAVRSAAATHGLLIACSLGLSPATDVSSESPDRVAAGVALLHDAVDVAADAGAGWLCGVLASALGKYAGPPTPAGRANAVAALREVTQHAAHRDLDLGLEVVNRYESNLVTTVADGLAFIDDVGNGRLWLHLDAYHALIEEDSMEAAVWQAGERLGYVHVAQNDRGALDRGTVDVDGLLASLTDVGYRGPITFEAFSRATSAPDLADTLGVWRSPWTDGRQLAADALAYMRPRVGQ